MDFRNLHEFNLALLEKQCWRLIHEPNSLWAQMFKGRYYSDCSIFYAKKREDLLGSGQAYLLGDKFLPGDCQLGIDSPLRLVRVVSSLRESDWSRVIDVIDTKTSMSLIFDYVKVTLSEGVHGIVRVKPLSHGGK
ncbi:hypothetical protein ACFX2J_002156 [Malus domestica]